MVKLMGEVALETRHLVDPELLPMLDVFPALTISRETLAETRATVAQLFEQMQPAADPTLAGITMQERQVPGPAGAPDVPVRIYQPAAAVGIVPALLWIHGGGYVLGSAAEDDHQVRTIVAATGCAAVSVDYRLAPEAPSPAAVEDCYAALRWLHDQAGALGVDPARLAIGGASAGGGLAACLGLLARDRGEVPVAFQLLIYPMLDDRTAASANTNPYTGEFIWTRESNHFGWASYLGEEPGGPDISPYAAAARATDVAGLPPTYISTCALDLFLEEDLEYTRRLMRAGVPTELHVYPGAFHGFDMVTEAQASRSFARDFLSALARGLRLAAPAG